MIAIYRHLLRARELIRYLVSAQLRASVHRTFLGTLWYLLIPAAQILTYYFLIVVVFNRGATYASGPFIGIMMGLMHYLVLMDAIQYAMPSIYKNDSILLQVRMEPAVFVAAGFYRAVHVFSIGLAIFFIFWFVLERRIDWPLLAYPIVLAVWLLLVWVLVFTAAVAAVFLRDLERLFPIVATLLMYFSPVVYTVEFIPEAYRGLYYLNPVAAVFALLHWALLAARFPPPHALLVLAASLVAGFLVSYALYRWARPRFTKAL